MNGKLNLLAVLLIAVASTTSSTLLQGQTTIWVGGGGNNLFSNGLNWSNGAPGPLHTARFETNIIPPSVINVLTDELFERLEVRVNSVTLSGDVNFNVQGTVDVEGSGELNLVNQITVNCDRCDPEGVVNVVNATVNTTGLIVIGNAATAGTLTISGGGVVSIGGSSSVFVSGITTVTNSGSQWLTANSLQIGQNATVADAVLNILDGGFVSGDKVRIGFSGTKSGRVNVAGSQSELFCGQDLDIGLDSDGELNISDFGRATVLENVNIDSGSMVSLSSNSFLQVAGEVINRGFIQITGSGLIDSDVEIPFGAGELEVAPNSVAKITGDLTHNGSDVSVASGSQLLVCGDWSGIGHFFGSGRVDMEAGVSPGHSQGNNIAAVLFAGDLNLGADTQTIFELAAEFSHDQLFVDKALSIDGTLTVNLVSGLQLEPNMQFAIVFVGESVSGTFDGLPEGALVGTYNGVDLFITYTGGDGNDVVLTTPSSIVLGDANDDGVFSNLDIAAFVLALTNPIAYQAMHSEVDPDVVLDMNGDGGFDNLDIASFVLALTGP